MNRDHAVGFGIGFLSGAVVAGIIVLLYAPKSGKETRQMIKEKATDVIDAVKGKSSGVVEALKS